MPIRPVSFLAQAAAQRQQTRENEANRQFQKEQALRDFGMNIGQSIVASLGNFGAQAGADAIRFNREEPYKMLESGVNPMPEVSVKQPVGTGASDMLSKAAMARTPLQAQTSAPPAPVSQPAPSRTPVTSLAAEFARAGGPAPAAKPPQPGPVSPAPTPAFDPYKAMRDPSSVLPRQAAPAASAPMSAPAPQRPSTPPPVREEVVSQSTSQRGDAPEAQAVKLRALQEMEKITQRWLSGEPLQFVKKDGTPADPREAAFAEAYQMKQDLARLDMLSKAGLIEAEEAKAVAYQIKAQAEGSAATQKANAYEREKAALAWKNTGAGAKSVTQNYGRNGQLTSGAPREFVVTNDPNAPMWPSVESVPDPEAPRRGGGMGGAPAGPGQIGGMVQLTPFDVNKRDAGIRPPPTPIPMTPEGLKAAASAATKTIGGAVGRWGQTAEEAKEALDYAAKAENQSDPAIKQQLVNEGFAVLKRAQARELGEYAGTAEVVTTSPADVLKATEDAEKAKRAEEAKAAAAKLAAGSRAQKAREDAVKEADAARNLARAAPKASDLFPGLDGEDAGAAYAALKSGARRPAVVPVAEWNAATGPWNKWLKAQAVYANRVPAALKKFKENGGTEEQFYELVPRDESDQPAPGPSEQTPGQFPPPGDESKVDDLFQRIESQPWSAERKRRVFLARAREAGLA